MRAEKRHVRTTTRRIALVSILLSGLCWAKNGALRPTTNILDAEFPRINSDLSATFRVQADQAQKVQLLMELGQSTYDMVKGKEDYVRSGICRRPQARRDESLCTRRRDMTGALRVIQSYTSSTDMVKTRLVGVTRAMKTSFSTTSSPLTKPSR